MFKHALLFYFLRFLEILASRLHYLVNFSIVRLRLICNFNNLTKHDGWRFGVILYIAVIKIL